MENMHYDRDLSAAWRCHFDRREGIQRILEATFIDVGPLALRSIHGWVEALATVSDESFDAVLRDVVAEQEVQP
jgi:hypothetical protein